MQSGPSVFITFMTYESVIVIILWSLIWCWPSQLFLSYQNSFTWLVKKNCYIFVIDKKTLIILKALFRESLEGATKSYFAHYSYVVIILLNTGLCRSAFSTISFVKLVFRLSMLFVIFALN